MSRAAMMASATAAVALASCSAYGASPCTDSVILDSPCGFQRETFTCVGATVTCKSMPDAHVCTFGPITNDCTITVVLGDGTSHDVAVTVRPAPADCLDAKFVIASAGSLSLSSATCRSPGLADDGSSDASLE